MRLIYFSFIKHFTDVNNLLKIHCSISVRCDYECVRRSGSEWSHVSKVLSGHESKICKGFTKLNFKRGKFSLLFLHFCEQKRMKNE